MSLKESFATLTTSFVDGILAAIQTASFADLARFSADIAPPGPRSPVQSTSKPAPAGKRAPAAKSGRLPRRTPAQIAEVVNTVATLLRNRPAGLRSEQIRAELRLDARELPRVIQHGIADGSFRVLSGQKRATVYGIGAVKSAKPAKAPAKKVAKKAAVKVKRVPARKKKA